MTEKQKTEMDARLLEELRRRAEEQGRPETEDLEEAVGRYLEAPTLLCVSRKPELYFCQGENVLAALEGVFEAEPVRAHLTGLNSYGYAGFA